MPRVALGIEQKRANKEIDLKLWVKRQIKENELKRTDVAKALNVTPARVSQMLKIPKKGERVKTDVFSYGTLLILCDLFKVDGNEKEKLLTL